MKKVFSIILLSLFTSFSCLAANNSDAAKKILDKAAAKIDIKGGATASFSISGGKLGKQSGTIAIKGNKFCATTAASIMWYDGKTQWLYNKKNEEVNVSTPSPSNQQSMNPYAILNSYKNGYVINMEKTASGDNNIHLTGKGKSISEMYLLIDKANNIKQAKVKQGGQWITITLSSLKATKLADSAFRFNSKDYPKAEVIDLR